MPWTSTWTLTSSRIDPFAHLGQHGDDPHQKSLAGFHSLLVSQAHNLACVEDCAHAIDLDVNVNEFSHRLIDSFAHLGQETSSSRRPVSRAQAYGQQSTTTSTITSTSTCMPVGLELGPLHPTYSAGT